MLGRRQRFNAVDVDQRTMHRPIGFGVAEKAVTNLHRLQFLPPRLWASLIARRRWRTRFSLRRGFDSGVPPKDVHRHIGCGLTHGRGG